MAGVLITIGVIIILLGIVLWKIRDESCTSEGNVDLYSEAIGKATIVLGSAIILMGIIDMISFIPIYLGAIAFAIGLIVSMIMFYRAQKKFCGRKTR